MIDLAINVQNINYSSYLHNKPLQVIESRYSPINDSTIPKVIIDDNSLLKAEIKEMIDILKRNNIVVEDFWVPNKELNKRNTILLKCKIPNDIKNDMEKLSDFEYEIYTSLKPFLKNSKFFKMAALL